jgi:phosphate transport system protein
MSKDRYHNEIDKLKNKVQEMGNLAATMLKESIESLKSFDGEKAKEIISLKTKLSNLDSTIEEESLQLIALHQPVASDMRTLGAILKIITYLNRIGRYGKDIAAITIEMEGNKHISELIAIPRMSSKVNEMLKDALSTFDKGDISTIKNMSERDTEIDLMRWTIFRECLEFMIEGKENIEKGAYYMMVVRYLERCADHVCKICEKVHYMYTGERVEFK